MTYWDTLSSYNKKRAGDVAQVKALCLTPSAGAEGGCKVLFCIECCVSFRFLPAQSPRINDRTYNKES